MQRSRLTKEQRTILTQAKKRRYIVTGVYGRWSSDPEIVAYRAYCDEKNIPCVYLSQRRRYVQVDLMTPNSSFLNEMASINFLHLIYREMIEAAKCTRNPHSYSWHIREDHLQFEGIAKERGELVAWDTYHICLNNTLPSTMDYDEYEQMRESIKLALDNIHNEYKNKTFLDEINVARVQNGLRPMKAKTDRQYKSSLLRRWEKLPYKRKYRDTFVESELPDLIDLVGVDAYEEMLDRLGNGESRRRVEELLSGTDY